MRAKSQNNLIFFERSILDAQNRTENLAFCSLHRIFATMKNKNMAKKIVWTLVIVVAICIVALIASGFYMLDYSLSPDPHRTDTDLKYKELFAEYPETVAWIDSLNQHKALRDTFMTDDEGNRHHAYYIKKGGKRTAFVIHGWRDQAIEFFYLARMYEREFGYNVVVPDLYASGKSEGDVLQMGWLDRLDVLQWLNLFKTDTMVVHGVSMGGATTMMLSGEPVPDGIKDIRFVDDCGYTSVWDEFEGELKNQFNLPAFPLMHTTSLLCQLRYGWNFDEASAISQVKKCPYPMFFIHGDNDTFVPTEMVHRLYKTKSEPKQLWITKNTGHAQSYKNHREEYINKIREYISTNYKK